MKKTIVIFLLLTMVMGLASCSSNETSMLVGKWECTDNAGGTDGFVRGDMELFSDGTIIVHGSATSWKVVDGYFMLADEVWGSQPYNYEIKNGVLTIARSNIENAEKLTFTKK